MALAGYRLTSVPAEADVAIVTTCAFLEAAVTESESAVRRVLAVKRKNPGVKVVVAGCLVQRFGREVTRRLPGVDLFVGLDQMNRIPELLSAGRQVLLSKRPVGLCSSKSPRLLSTPAHYAWLKIADGCDNLCAYCLIPGIRGRLRSRSVGDIVREAQDLCRIGVRELILVAQDTTAYGKDIYAKPALPRLLNQLGRIPELHWLRLMYTHPAHVTDRLLREYEQNPKLCRYIDLPLQHTSDRILRAMNRRYCRADIERLLTRLRAIPEMRIRTTLITGFPGETESEFEELLDFVRKYRFDRLGGYAYSSEPGTRAAALRNQIPEPVRQERLGRLMRVQASISRRNLRSLLGCTLEVGVDSPGIGRTQWDAPEIDGVVRLTGSSPRPGTFVQVKVTGTQTHDLVGRVPTRSPSVRRHK